MEKTVFVFFGLIASGKSTLAGAWARRLHIPYYNSDRVRKELAGMAPISSMSSKFNEGIYSKEFTRKTYDALIEKAEKDLANNSSVVLDASYQNRDERERLRKLSESSGCRLIFILCQCSEMETRRRLDLRVKDPHAVSDGRWEIYLKQKESYEAPAELGKHEFITIDTSDTVDNLLGYLTNRLSSW